MSLPLLLFVLLATWMFGWAMMHHQHVVMSDRYAAWREIRGAGRCRPAALNERFFADKAGEVGIRHARGPGDETVQDLIAFTGRYSSEGRGYSSRLMQDRLPRDLSARVRAQFPSDIPLWNRLMVEGIVNRHVREGREWRRDEAACESAVRESFLDTLDERLRRLDSPSNRLGDVLRHLYDTTW
ncbi:MAG: hypothetical protein KGY99_03190 [Phycisphaerae bacterium]|nr:hypothetical protein [Phycisphaerae bacterium]